MGVSFCFSRELLVWLVERDTKIGNRPFWRFPDLRQTSMSSWEGCFGSAPIFNKVAMFNCSK